ncbi:hypothetical protein OC844_001434, partial [Tilletia horrida]
MAHVNSEDCARRQRQPQQQQQQQQQQQRPTIWITSPPQPQPPAAATASASASATSPALSSAAPSSAGTGSSLACFSFASSSSASSVSSTSSTASSAANSPSSTLASDLVLSKDSSSSASGSSMPAALVALNTAPAWPQIAAPGIALGTPAPAPAPAPAPGPTSPSISLLRSSPSRPKLPRLNTGDKITTLKPMQHAATLPFHLAAGPDADPAVGPPTLTDDASLKTSRPPSPRGRSGPSSPSSLFGSEAPAAAANTSDMRLHPASAATALAVTAAAGGTAVPAGDAASGFFGSRRSSGVALSPTSSFCATTASFLAASARSPSTGNSRASSPSSLRPPASELSSSVGSNRTLNLSIRPSISSLRSGVDGAFGSSPGPSRRPTLTLSPVATYAPPDVPVSSWLPVGSNTTPSGPSLSRPSSLQQISASPASLNASLGSDRTRASRCSGSDWAASVDSQTRIASRPSSSSSSGSAGSLGGSRLLDNALPARGMAIDTVFTPNRAAGPSSASTSSFAQFGSSQAADSPSTRSHGHAPSPLPSAVEMTSPWSIASAHCGGSEPSSPERPIKTGSVRSTGSASKRRSPEHMDRLRRTFVASPPSDHAQLVSESGYLQLSKGPDKVWGEDEGLLGHRRRKSSADYESSRHQHHHPHLHALSSSSSAPPALNPTPIIPDLLFLGPAPSHATHWAELHALG